MAVRTGTTKPVVVIAIVIAVMVASLIFYQEGQRLEPGSEIEMETELDRELLAYAIWDDIPLVVFKYTVPMKLFDGVCLSQVDLDWMANGVRFVPEWEISGGWSCIDRTNDPASVKFARGWWGNLLYGQVNDPSIVTVEGLVNGNWEAYPIVAPGYLVRLPEDGEEPDEYRFLNANGVVVWTIDPDDEE